MRTDPPLFTTRGIASLAGETLYLFATVTGLARETKELRSTPIELLELTPSNHKLHYKSFTVYYQKLAGILSHFIKVSTTFFLRLIDTINPIIVALKISLRVLSCTYMYCLKFAFVVVVVLLIIKSLTVKQRDKNVFTCYLCGRHKTQVWSMDQDYSLLCGLCYYIMIPDLS